MSDFLKALPWLSLLKLTAEVLGLAAAAWWASRPVRQWLVVAARKIARNHVTLDHFHELHGPAPAHSIKLSLDALNIQQARRLVREHYDKHGAAAFICNLAGECTWVSPQLSKLFGIPGAEMLEHGWSRVLETQEERARVVASWTDAVRNNNYYEQEYKVYGAPCVARAWPIKINGKAVEYYGTVEPKE